jgi:hypothetical protein
MKHHGAHESNQMSEADDNQLAAVAMIVDELMCKDIEFARKFIGLPDSVSDKEVQRQVAIIHEKNQQLIARLKN